MRGSQGDHGVYRLTAHPNPASPNPASPNPASPNPASPNPARLESLGFETAVFDEAAQASELATLVPLQHGARRVVLVGDPQQLPATVLSREAKRLGLGRSLFERLQRSAHRVTMLQTQFRMHPAIRSFPSRHFYEGKLLDAEPMALLSSRSPGAEGGSPAFLLITPTPTLTLTLTLTPPR